MLLKAFKYYLWKNTNLLKVFQLFSILRTSAFKGTWISYLNNYFFQTLSELKYNYLLLMEICATIATS